MGVRRRTAVAVSSLCAVLALTGCTPQASASAPAAQATQQAPAAPVASTPSPEPSYPTCASLVPSSTLARVDPALVLQAPIGYTIAPPADGALPNTRAVFLSAVNPPSATTVLAALRAGYFDCEWGDPPSYLHYLRVAVLPDAAASFDSATRSKVYDIATFDELAEGTRSVGGCSNGDGRSCDIETLSGTTWISAHESSSDVSAGTSSLFRARLESIIHSSIAVVAAAGPLVSAQHQPTSRWQSPGDCSVIDDAVRTIVPSTRSDHVKQRLESTDAYDPVFRAAVVQSGGFACSSGTVNVVPGADASAPVVYTSDATTPVAVTIPGVVSARDSCVAADAAQCWTEGYIDHALVTVSNRPSAPERHAILAAIAAAGAAG
ncbi:hypothetical protein [Leifsonia sp. NPDC058248]|uniref:hypothetical protein n=1 Tax=Leifsonia sp. NPDC058248 TaxID=3346402 RepID=UPI0036DF2CED